MVGIAAYDLTIGFNSNNYEVEARVTIEADDGASFYRQDLVFNRSNDFYIIGLVNFCNENLSRGTHMTLTTFQNARISFDPSF